MKNQRVLIIGALVVLAVAAFFFSQKQTKVSDIKVGIILGFRLVIAKYFEDWNFKSFSF